MNKKRINYIVIIILAGIFVYSLYAWLLNHENPGYALIGLGEISFQSTAVVFFIGLLFAFIFLYIVIRLLGGLLRMPSKMMTTRQHNKSIRSQNALIEGLVDSAAGNWANAEKVLIRHASNSGAPLLHYLTAARAAQFRGAIDKRDEYLKKAAHDEDANIAVGLTQAELNLSQHQFKEAANTLIKLNSGNPNHVGVLNLLYQTYHHLNNWEGIRQLLPSLHKNKVMGAAEMRLLEIATYSRLLKEASEKKQASDLTAVWTLIPANIQDLNEIRYVYFSAMIIANGGGNIEKNVVKAVSDNWSDVLLVIFGNIESDNYFNQLLTAEKWLASHPDNFILLRILGKISLKCDQPEKAEAYLSKSLHVEPTVAAYQLLGDVFYDKGNKDKASEYYKYGLELASNKIKHNLETVLSDAVA
jgi:HemY protein